jgi:hypothetical protein
VRGLGFSSLAALAAAGPAPGLTHLGGRRFRRCKRIRLASFTAKATTTAEWEWSPQNFEPEFDSFDSQLADDFVVPDAGRPWQITGITVTGQSLNGSGPARSENVTFYKGPNGVPGEVKNAQTVVGVDSNGSFTIPLEKFALAPGHLLGLSPGEHRLLFRQRVGLGNPNRPERKRCSIPKPG